MDQDVASIISRLETRTRQLIMQYDQLKIQLANAEQKLLDQQQHCLSLEAENQELKDNYARLKMARMIDMIDDDELKTTRKRINKMIASVDKCLATLKVQ